MGGSRPGTWRKRVLRGRRGGSLAGEGAGRVCGAERTEQLRRRGPDAFREPRWNSAPRAAGSHGESRAAKEKGVSNVTASLRTQRPQPSQPWPAAPLLQGAPPPSDPRGPTLRPPPTPCSPRLRPPSPSRPLSSASSWPPPPPSSVPRRDTTHTPLARCCREMESTLPPDPAPPLANPRAMLIATLHFRQAFWEL